MELTQVTCVNKLITATGKTDDIKFFEATLDQARENIFGNTNHYDKKALMSFIENSQLQPIDQILFHVTDAVFKSKEESEEQETKASQRLNAFAMPDNGSSISDPDQYYGLNVPTMIVNDPSLGAVVLVAVKFKYQPTRQLEYVMGWDAELATLQFANGYFPTAATIVEKDGKDTTTAYMLMLYTEIVEICQWLNDIEPVIQHHVENHCVPELSRGRRY